MIRVKVLSTHWNPNLDVRGERRSLLLFGLCVLLLRVFTLRVVLVVIVCYALRVKRGSNMERGLFRSCARQRILL
jgi:hypothetical protein